MRIELFLMLLPALGGPCALANFITQPMSAQDLETIVSSQAAFKANSACSLSAEYTTEEPSSRSLIGFTLRSTQGTTSVVLDPLDQLQYTYDTESGELYLEGLGLSIQAVDWHTVKAIQVKGLRCAP